jgi:hypothetical protein
MALNLGAETSLTNHNIIEFDKSNEDNIEEEVEANQNMVEFNESNEDNIEEKVEANNENGKVFFLVCV